MSAPPRDGNEHNIILWLEYLFDTIRVQKDTIAQHAAVDMTTDDTDYAAAEIDCEKYTDFLLLYSLTETGVVVNGDRVRIRIQFREAGGTWCDYYTGPFGALFEEESTIPIDACVSGRCIGERMRVVATSDYTNATPANNYFTITSNVTLLR